MQQHAVGAAHAAPAAGDGVEEFLMLGGELITGDVVETGHELGLLAEWRVVVLAIYRRGVRYSSRGVMRRVPARF